MDTNISNQPTPEIGMQLRVTLVGQLMYAGRTWIGRVVRVFPRGVELPEEEMRRYYKPRPGSKWDLNPRLLTKAGRYDRVVLEIGPNHNVVYPHQRYFQYEVLNAPKVRSQDPGPREQEPG